MSVGKSQAPLLSAFPFPHIFNPCPFGRDVIHNHTINHTRQMPTHQNHEPSFWVSLSETHYRRLGLSDAFISHFIVEVGVNFGVSNTSSGKGSEPSPYFIVWGVFNCGNTFDYTVTTDMFGERADVGSDVFGNSLADWGELNTWNEVAGNELNFHSIG